MSKGFSEKMASFVKSHDHEHKHKKHHAHAHAQVDNDEDFADGLTNKEHDFKTTIKIDEGGAKGLTPYEYMQSEMEIGKEAAPAAAKKLSRPAGPVRGEKEW